ncbi:hypothetical protein LMG28138_00938 [Pararobbsia alpina]|uniref:Uncharacterized protein n=1 Tax=Pararobbsia alpina TaxID=621374 RepID=A0A6S7C361_9BURK|nr:hypothetical protein LMG28138_00938 [Pararobbsia alpina]
MQNVNEDNITQAALVRRASASDPCFSQISHKGRPHV